MHDVNSFFRTKLAQAKKEDPIIDPGEAAAAGLAMAYGPFAQKTFPFVSSLVLNQISDIGDPWGGSTIAKLKDLKGAKLSKEEIDIIKGYSKNYIKQIPGLPFTLDELVEGGKVKESLQKKLLEGVNKPRSVLGGLFKVTPKPSDHLATEKNLQKLIEIQDSVNSMLDKYKLPKKGVTIGLTSGPLSRISGPSYDIATKEISIPILGKESFLHEIGHAGHMTGKGAKAANLARTIIQKGANIAVPLSFVVGDEIQKMFPGKVDDKIVKFVQDNAPAIISSTYAAATLYPEVQATTRAVKHVYNTEGIAAAKKTFKKLLPPLLSYVIPVIPSIVGIGMARKWHREAKEKEKELKGIMEKESSIPAFVSYFPHRRELWDHSAYIGRQILDQAKSLFRQPLKKVTKDIYEASKNVTKSPDFAVGASLTGIPAALGAYTLFNTPHGEMYREKSRRIGFRGEEQHEKEKKYEKNIWAPVIIGATAAISGGFLNKLMSDIYKVM